MANLGSGLFRFGRLIASVFVVEEEEEGEGGMEVTISFLSLILTLLKLEQRGNNINVGRALVPRLGFIRSHPLIIQGAQ